MALDSATVQEWSRRLGLGLSPEEVEVYRPHLQRFVGDAGAFLRDTEPAPRPDGVRDSGHRATPEEDPHGAWIWKCEIRGATAGVLEGRTVSFKDHIAVAGLPMTIGSKLLEGLVPNADAAVVERVLAAGGTITGKHVLNGVSSDYGAPRNPTAPDRLAGGSSSGSAVAVAAGEVDISFGGDQGGSVRMPAAYCGVVGFKPTFGLISHFGATFGSEPSIDHVGPIARTVEDVARAVEATAGRDPRDPRQTSEVPERLDVLSSLDVPLERPRIGVLREGFADVDEPIRRAVELALERLVVDGAELVDVSAPRYEELHMAQQLIMPEGALAVRSTGFAGAFARTEYPEGTVAATHRLLARQAHSLSDWSKFTLLAGAIVREQYDGVVYARAHNLRRGYIAMVDELLAGLDVMVMPTVPTPPPLRPTPGERLTDLDAGFARMQSSMTRNTFPFNYTGHPALAVPVTIPGELPASLQVVGRMFDDVRVLRIGRMLESAP